MKKFCYLGHVLERSNADKEHIIALTAKARGIVVKVRGIGQSLFKNDIDKRFQLFATLVKSIMLDGVKIEGWVEKGTIEMCRKSI